MNYSIIEGDLAVINKCKKHLKDTVRDTIT
jgi:hypothetical protein